MQVDQNLFRPGSTGSLLFAAESRFGGRRVPRRVRDREHHAELARRPARGPAAGRTGARALAADAPARCRATPLAHRVDDTMMYVELAQPLAPGGTTVFDLAYRFNVPEHGADRMGRDGSLYEIAQWYPRMAVYDDVHGWNTDQYLGQGEFYLEYGDIDYEVTAAGRLHRRRERRPAESGAGADADAARPAGRGGQVRQHDGDRHPGRAGLRRRAPASATACSPGGSAPSGSGTWPGRPRPTTSGTRRAGTACWRRRTTGPSARDHLAGRRQDEPLLHPGVQHALVPLSVPADLRRSRGRSRAWSIRWSRWRPGATTGPTCTT